MTNPIQNLTTPSSHHTPQTTTGPLRANQLDDSVGVFAAAGLPTGFGLKHDPNAVQGHSSVHAHAERNHELTGAAEKIVPDHGLTGNHDLTGNHGLNATTVHDAHHNNVHDVHHNNVHDGHHDAQHGRAHGSQNLAGAWMPHAAQHRDGESVAQPGLHANIVL